MAIKNRKSKLTFYQEEIINILLKHPKGLSKKQLSIAIYDLYDPYTVRALDQHIHKLRKKVVDLGLGELNTRKYPGFRVNGGKVVSFTPKSKEK